MIFVYVYYFQEHIHRCQNDEGGHMSSSRITLSNSVCVCTCIYHVRGMMRSSLSREYRELLDGKVILHTDLMMKTQAHSII